MWKFLLKYLFPAIDEEVSSEDDAPIEEVSAEDDAPLEEVSSEDDAPIEEVSSEDDAPVEPAAPRISRAQQAITATRERAQKAERELEEARKELIAARAKPAAPSQDELLYRQEEETLRDPNLEPWQRYAITTARQSRQAMATSQSVMARAEDMSDKADFRSIRVNRPALFDKYEAKVEERIASIRASGQPVPPRKAVLAYMMGEDQLNGTVKAKPPPRSSTPSRSSARSDVSTSRGGEDRYAAAMARLEGKRI